MKIALFFVNIFSPDVNSTHVPCHSLTTHCSSKGKGKEEGKSESEGENNEKVKSNSAPQDLVGSLQVSSKGKRKAEGELTSEAENDANGKSSNVSCDCGFMELRQGSML